MVDVARQAARRAALERLRGRFTALELRSRTLRLMRPTQRGAVDLSRLPSDARARLMAALTSEAPSDVALIAARGVGATHADLSRDLRVLARAAADDLRETGLEDLALAWPLLEGVLPDGTYLRAPVLLRPVRLEARRVGARWTHVLRLDDEAEVNPSLAATLERLLGLDLSTSAILSEDADGALAPDRETLGALHAALTSAGLALEPLPARSARAQPEPLPTVTADARDRWPAGRLELANHWLVGRFPPSGSALVADYEALLAPPDADFGAERLGVAAALLALDEPPEDLAHSDRGATSLAPTSGTTRAVEAADSPALAAFASDESQDALLRWLDEAPEGHGLVVQGPPGTGKSQLIANLIAASLGRGLRVLVACDKRAALDVVQQRLASRGLAEPLALVHDVRADRAALVRGLAQTVERALAAADPRAEAERSEVGLHTRTPDAARLGARLDACQQARDSLVGRPHGRPSLVRLQARLADDDGRRLPELGRDLARGVGEVDAHAALPAVEALAPDARDMAAPHPLHVRGDWSTHTPRQTRALREAIAALDVDLAGLATPGGVMSPREAVGRDALWEVVAPLIATLEGGTPADAAATSRWLVAWEWSGGRDPAGQGAWHRVIAALNHASETLRPASRALVAATDDELTAAREALADAGRVGTRWYRGLSPTWWRARSATDAWAERARRGLAEGRALAVVPEAATRSGVPARVAALEDALDAAEAWRSLNAGMPSDDPLLGFGFTGDPAEVLAALGELAGVHARVMAVHRAHELLRDLGGPYAELPDLASADTPEDAPFVRALLADHRRRAAVARLDAALAALDEAEGARPAVGERLARWLRGVRDVALEGGRGIDEARRRLAALLDAWTPEAEARAKEIDRAARALPAWGTTFLRRWAGGDRLADDLLRALDRGFRDAALAGRSERGLEAPLVDQDALAALDRDDREVRAGAGERLVTEWRARLAARAADPDGGAALRRLAADAGRRRKRPSVRQLVQRWWDHGLAAARPVWLCAPDSVAALFPPDVGLFDVVIIDEASQCPVEAGLPVLLRGRRALVAGDAKQLPPTRFFQATHGFEPDTSDPAGGVDGAEAEAFEGALLASPSLLDAATVAYPGAMLQWHYRSWDEGLVAFSNAAFYGGQLVTAPRAEGVDGSAPPWAGLRFHRVDGLWDGGTNEVEAEHVVTRLAELLAMRDPRTGSAPSVGVVTFNLTQADTIASRLEARAYDDDALAEALRVDRTRPATEQLFIRNLENVQGDERDVIVFSVGYGPTQEAGVGGPVQARFGPLGTLGGERRLNVAVTRAKASVEVVASFEPARLDVSRTKRVGPKLLKTYLLYVQAMSAGRLRQAGDALAEARRLGGAEAWEAAAARRARAVEAPDSPEAARAWVRERVASELEAHGLVVTRDVGTGREKLDLAVARPGEPARLGVDCGGFLDIADARSRDVHRRRFWARAGWTVWRATPRGWRETAADLARELGVHVSTDDEGVRDG